ncbi:MAG: hypothetical protein ABI969_15770, partial [bacterium]
MLPFARSAVLRCAALVGALVFGALALPAQQQLPTTEQAKRLLATRPDLVAQLRREIASSGLTPDQIRARLRAAGYPEDILDAFVGPRRPGLDSAKTDLPSVDVLDAVAALGISDTVETSELRQLVRSRSRVLRDTLRDTVRTVRDRRLMDAANDTVAVADTLIETDSLGLLHATPVRRRRRVVASDSGFTLFGLSVFDAQTTQFDPNLAGPVDANYRLGPGDRIVLILTGDAERSYTLDVTR